MVRLPTLLPEMERSKTVHALPKTVTTESFLEEEPAAKKWPPLTRSPGGQRGPSDRKGLSVVGFQRAATVSRAFSSKGTARSLQRTSTAGSAAESVEGTEHSNALEEENQRLREELARYQADVIPLRRRPMAAIAGGGFRAAGPQRQCNCEALKAKLARCQAALAAAHRKRSMTVAFDMVDLPEERPPGSKSEQATATDDAASSEEEKVPPPPPCSPCGLPPILGSEEARSSVSTEASIPGPFSTVSTDAEVQAKAAFAEVAVQAVTPSSMDDKAVQVAPLVTAPAETQTEAESLEPAMPAEDVEAAVVEIELVAAETQTEASTPGVSADTQTEGIHPPATSTAESQTEVLFVPHLQAVETQTEIWPPPLILASRTIQTEELPSPPMLPTSPSVRECSSQTTPIAQTVVAVQTAPQKGVSCGTQVERPKVGQQAVQAEDASEKEALARVKQLEAAAAAEAGQLQAWRDMAKAKAVGRLNVTILCPRAECNVNGVKVEMDSWRSEQLRNDFEEQVLPKFVRLIVSEIEESNKELVRSMMEELGSIFRERLSALLAAPNATAAMAAAKAAKAA